MISPRVDWFHVSLFDSINKCRTFNHALPTVYYNYFNNIIIVTDIPIYLCSRILMNGREQASPLPGKSFNLI